MIPVTQKLKSFLLVLDKNYREKGFNLLPIDFYKKK